MRYALFQELLEPLQHRGQQAGVQPVGAVHPQQQVRQQVRDDGVLHVPGSVVCQVDGHGLYLHGIQLDVKVQSGYHTSICKLFQAERQCFQQVLRTAWGQLRDIQPTWSGLGFAVYGSLQSLESSKRFAPQASAAFQPSTSDSQAGNRGRQ